MINPMSSLPGFGAILKNRCKLAVDDEDRTLGDFYASVLDYLIGVAWSFLGLWPEEEKKHRAGVSILEIQEFLDWAMRHLIEDMEWIPEELDTEFDQAVKAWLKAAESKENEGENHEK